MRLCLPYISFVRQIFIFQILQIPFLRSTFKALRSLISIFPTRNKFNLLNLFTSSPMKIVSTTLFPSLSLKNVLHVLKSSINLLSIYQVTKDLDYRVIFYPTHYVFQYWVMGRMIGHVKEKNGLYFLETTGGSGNQPSHSYLSNNLYFNKDSIQL